MLSITLKPLGGHFAAGDGAAGFFLGPGFFVAFFVGVGLAFGVALADGLGIGLSESLTVGVGAGDSVTAKLCTGMRVRDSESAKDKSFIDHSI
jgi:hypothetical protein